MPQNNSFGQRILNKFMKGLKGKTLFFQKVGLRFIPTLSAYPLMEKYQKIKFYFCTFLLIEKYQKIKSNRCCFPHPCRLPAYARAGSARPSAASRSHRLAGWTGSPRGLNGDYGSWLRFDSGVRVSCRGILQ